MRASGATKVIDFTLFLTSFISKPFKTCVGVSTAAPAALGSGEEGRHPVSETPIAKSHAPTYAPIRAWIKEALPPKGPVRPRARWGVLWRRRQEDCRSGSGAGPPRPLRSLFPDGRHADARS